MPEEDGMPPELAMYIKRIGDVREIEKYGRAVQLCDKAMEHDPDPELKNVILNFKGDSLYWVGIWTGNPEILQEARACFIEVLEHDSEDYLAQKGLETIDFMETPEETTDFTEPSEETTDFTELPEEQ
jgi:hypothetical protein